MGSSEQSSLRPFDSSGMDDAEPFWGLTSSMLARRKERMGSPMAIGGSEPIRVYAYTHVRIMRTSVYTYAHVLCMCALCVGPYT